MNTLAIYKEIIKKLSSNLSLVYTYLQLAFDTFGTNHQEGEPQEHHLGEVLQEMSKSKFYIIILYDSSVFLGSGFHNPNYLEIKNILFKVSVIFQNIPKYLN